MPQHTSSPPDDWRQTTRQERNRRIFEEELDAFLPRKILDFHVHLINPGVIPAGRTFSCAGYPITAYTREDLAQNLADALPRREVAAVCFGFPEVSYDRQLNNEYLASCGDGRRFFALRLLDPHHDTPESLRADLATGKFCGLKPYPDYVRAPSVNDVEIAQMLPPWAMEIADEHSSIIMLHIPRPGRLADPVNQRQIIELCTRYPRAKVVLAHIGRAYFLKNIAGNIEPLADLPNLWFDLAMVSNWEVIEYLFEYVPPEKALFGSDMPIALAPGKAVEINDQYAYVTPIPWPLSICDSGHKIVFTSFLYEQLRAIRKAARRVGMSRGEVEGLFWSNGTRLLRDP